MDKTRRLRFKAVGDNLIHKELYRAAALPEGGYCFDRLFDGVRERLREADVAALNQETILVRDASRVSSFPSFGSPVQVGEAAARAGFTVVTHASNHALDKGLSGVQETIAFWRERESAVRMLGLHESAAEQAQVPVIMVNGIRLALLNYTEKLNYRPLPLTAPYCVDVMKPRRKRALRAQLQRAREQADFVVVFPHWGCEYLYEPVASQREWAAFFAEAGADLIVGTHPHVVQNAEWLTAPDGRRVLCLYSLGNFVSCQVKAGTMLGAMAEIEIEKPEGGGARIVSQRLTPLVTHTDADYSFFTTYLLDDYADALCRENKIFQVVRKNYGLTVDCAYLRGLFEDILAGRAQAYNEFQRPWDVTRSNIRGVCRALLGRNTKE